MLARPAPASGDQPEATRPRGRPRSSAVDAAILEATMRCLARDGYQDLTLSAVAKDAGVGRAAIYRRYGSKSELTADALLHVSVTEATPMPTDTREALRALLGAAGTALSSPGTLTILGSLLAQGPREPELYDVLRRVIFDPRRDVVADVLTSGIGRGDVRTDVDTEVVVDLLFGSLLARAMDQQPVTDGWLDRILMGVWPSIVSKEQHSHE